MLRNASLQQPYAFESAFLVLVFLSALTALVAHRREYASFWMLGVVGAGVLLGAALPSCKSAVVRALYWLIFGLSALLSFLGSPAAGLVVALGALGLLTGDRLRALASAIRAGLPIFPSADEGRWQWAYLVVSEAFMLAAMTWMLFGRS